MTSKERINAILNGSSIDRTGFWSGVPMEEALQRYFDYFHVDKSKVLYYKLGNDLVHIAADHLAWPNSGGFFNFYGGKPQTSFNQPDIFAECEDYREVEAYHWPDPDLLNFAPVITEIESYKDKAVFSGMWSMFYHDLCCFFGMDNYFIKMYTNPEVVEAVTEKVVNFYVEANKRCFDAIATKIDAFFFGNDFGSQESLLVSPECFRKFILPGVSKLIALAKSYGLKVVMHSCGSIAEIIPDLINAGIDALHPLQARAKGMDAETLAREYKKDIAFIGGVDTQQLLPFGTPEDVKTEVRRLKKVFGERLVISPSHEAILPIVNPENIVAMRDAALEYP